MKTISHISLLIFSILTLLSCDKDYDNITSNTGLTGVFITNESGTISFYDEVTGTVTADIYQEVNGTGIGKKILALQTVGQRGYILRGEGSNQEIELINEASFESEKVVGGFNNLTDLKAISDQFVCVTQGTEADANSGAVLLLDSVNLDTEISLEVGKNPTRIAYSRGKKVYVANSGSEAYPDSTIMVLDIASKEITDTIALEEIIDESTTLKLKSPVEMVIDTYQDIWVLCAGLNGQGAGIARVSYTSHEVKVFPFEGAYQGPGRNGLLRSLGGATIYFINNGTYAMSVDDESLPLNQFFPEDTYKSMNFSTIGINPYTGKFFCAADGSSGENGMVYVFNKHGYFNDNQFEVGVMPRQFTFVR